MTKEQIREYLIDYAVDQMTKFFMDDHHVGMAEALDVIYNSDTYAKLTDAEGGLYVQSPAYVYEILDEEYRFGRGN